MLFYSIPFSSILFYYIIFYIILIFSILFFSWLNYTVLHCTILDSNVLYRILTRPFLPQLLSLHRLFVLPANRQMGGLRLPSPSAVTMVQRHMEIKEFHMSQIGSNPVKARARHFVISPLSLHDMIVCILLLRLSLPFSFNFIRHLNSSRFCLSCISINHRS